MGERRLDAMEQRFPSTTHIVQDGRLVVEYAQATTPEQRAEAQGFRIGHAAALAALSDPSEELVEAVAREMIENSLGAWGSQPGPHSLAHAALRAAAEELGGQDG